jgi:aspartate carbamoyltransferase catalytic subunit
VNKHLLSAADLSAGDIRRLLDTAGHLAKVTDRAIKKVPTLRGRTVCNLFFEDSTRTRISFELAAKRLSADVINFSARGSSVSKGESLKDTALTLEAMGVDAIVLRHGASGAAVRLAGWVQAHVINAGDGTHEHPTQALLDLFTMRQRFPSFEGLRVAIVGDVLHSRVARSNVLALKTMGAEVTLVAPPTLLPPRVDTWGVEVAYDLDAALPKQDVVMLLRLQLERQQAGFLPTLREYARLYGLGPRRLAAMPEHAIVMHPGPMNRGVEIAADVADSIERSVVTSQVANGISVRMALLYLLLGGPPLPEAEPEPGLATGRGVAS